MTAGLLTLLPAPFAGASGLVAQDAAVEAYLGGLSDHFGVPSDEVRVLSEWDIEAGEVAVVLFLAREGGVSADALIALHRGGRSWTDLAERYGMHAGSFHVPLPESASAGPLGDVYQRYRTTPSSGWSSLRLTDAELVQLVNLRVLSEYLNVPAAHVIEAWGRAGSFVAAYRDLIRSGG